MEATRKKIMRYVISLGLLGLAMMTGCALWRKDEADEPPMSPNRIEIDCFRAGNSPGAGGEFCHLTLEKSGPCSGMILSPSPFKFDVPTEAFEECLALLAKTDFFHMQSVRPKGQPGTRSRSLHVRYNGQEHSVEEVLPEHAPPGFDDLTNFVAAYAARGVNRSP
jgi:hypothetical protein